MTELRPETADTRATPLLRNPESLREIDRSIASLIILSSDGKLLMGRKDPTKGGVYPDCWHIPGGGIKEGESPEQAAIREGREEVGLDLTDATLTLLPFVGHGETVKTLPTGERVWCKMTFNRFEAQLDRSASEIELQPSEELVELRWFDARELEEVKQIPGGREFFIEAGYIKASRAV